MTIHLQISADQPHQEIDIRQGDMFATRNPMYLGRWINAIQRFWSRDNQSHYSHAGIILDSDGTTFEALWKIQVSDLSRYRGQKVIIARVNDMDAGKIGSVIKGLIARHAGKRYPLWRLLMHLFPPLAKISVFALPVCSELVAKYLYEIGVRHGQWAGTNPDTLSDEWVRWRWFEVLGEGQLL